MKVFVTGASGLVGSELVRQLVPQGHTVFGLARSDASAEKLKSLGVTPVRGQHTDLEVIAKAASEADATIHCAFNHEAFATGEYMLAIEQDKAAITAMCDALVGSGKTFINTGGIFGSDGPDEFSNKPNTAGFGSRGQNEKLTTSYLDKGVRALNVRLPPITHGPAKEHPFASGQIAIAKARGFAGYVEEGKNVWSSCDVVPAAEVYVLAIDKSKVIPKGAALHAVYEEGVATRDIAEFIGNKLGVPVKSISADEAGEHFGFLAMMLKSSGGATSALTQEWLGWNPKGVKLLERLEDYKY
jgi:nucleoside-diphosphate-sugar epimerase